MSRAFPDLDLYPGEDQFPDVTDSAVGHPASPGRGWNDWRAISREYRSTVAAERSRAPTGCPSCGEPLRRERGVLRCPFDGAQF